MMDQKALQHARARLQRAEQALSEMENMADDATFQDFEYQWSRFIMEANTVFTKLAAGASGATAAWFGRVRKQRGEDQLLRYIQHARNADEHGLADVTQRESTAWQFDVPEAGDYRLRNIGFGSDGTPTISIERPSGASVKGSWRPVLGKVKLIPVRDRGVWYGPPRDHLGQELTGEEPPLTIAELALNYLRSLVREAEARAAGVQRQRSS